MAEEIGGYSWDQLEPKLYSYLYNSSSDVQLGTLNRIEVLLQEEYDTQKANLVLLNLLKSYGRYTKKSLKSKVIGLFDMIIPRDLDHNLQNAIKFIGNVVDIKKVNNSIAVYDLDVLYHWITHFLSTYFDGKKSESLVADLLVYQFEILNQILYFYGSVKDASKKQPQVKANEYFISNRLIVKTYLSKGVIQNESLLKIAGSNKFNMPTQLLFISTLSALNTVEHKEVEFLTYYINNVLLNKSHKTIVDQLYVLSYFNQYFVKTYVTDELVTSNLLSDLEKSILRSSEFIVNNVLVGLVKTLQIDFSLLITNKGTFTKFFTQILSNMKSSNESVRANSFETLRIVLVRAKNTLDSANSMKIVDEAAKSWKSTSNVDYKVGYIKLVNFVNSQNNVDVCDKVLTTLSQFVTKDQNEQLFSEFLNAYCNSFLQAVLLRNEPLKSYDANINIVVNGLNEKKTNLRKYWFTNLGTYLLQYYDSASSNLNKLLNDIFPAFVSNFKELTANPLKFPTVIGYVILSVSNKALGNESVKKENFGAKLLEEPNSILVSSKLFLKLTTYEEKKWFINALFSIFMEPEVAENDKLGQTLVYVILSNHFTYKLRNLALEYLNDQCYCTQELVGKLISNALYEMLLTPEEVIRLDLNYKYVKPLLYAITCGLHRKEQEKDKEALSKTLIDLLVICNHSNVKIKDGWIGLVRKSGLNPGEVITLYGVDFFANTTDKLLAINDIHNDIYVAIIRSIAAISFFQPDLIGPLIRDLVQKDLTTDNHVNEESLAIWKAKAGELVNDPLAKKSKYSEDKNSKDYETRKWEENLKKEIEAKKGKTTKKLTREEQELVKKQLEKESRTRNIVADIYTKYNRSISIIYSLCDDLKDKINNGYRYWFADAINLLLDIIQQESSYDLLGDVAINAFLKGSNIISNENPSLNPVKVLVGITVLRLFDVNGIPDNYKQEPLVDLVLRMLFKIKFVSDNKPLDSFGLIYILPLLIEILNKKAASSLEKANKIISTVRTEFVEEDKDEEQLLLAIDIISNHAEIFVDTSIPRIQILKSLIHLMKIPTKAKISRDCFNSLCQNISENVSNTDLVALIQQLMSSNKFVRSTILEQIDEEFILDDLSPDEYIELWISCFDTDPTNAELAVSIWKENDLELANVVKLLNYLGIEDHGLRLSVAKAIGQGVGESFTIVFNNLLDLLEEKSKPPPPILDDYGLVIKSSEQQKDPWEYRSGVALSFKELAPHFDDHAILTFFRKLINENKFLGDANLHVQQELQDAAVEIINLHGLNLVQDLIPIFEQCLNEKDVKNRTQDSIKQSTVILYGALARHLSSNDPKLIQIVNQLIKALNSPSEDVQATVSKYIAPLVNLFTDKLSDYFDQLFDTLFNGKTIGQRRGAAYGIAGLVKGAGIKALSDYDIIRNLSEAAEDKRDPRKREGASFAFECLSKSLGNYFEPYVIEIIPLILKSLGDQSPEVRLATDRAAQTIMKHTTPFGVKKLIPLAIENLDEIAWRSKKGSVELLGSMAYLDPTQLSASLSTIVPEIVGVLNDSHKEVRKAADQALKRFGEVIRNPEIQKSVPVLIKAIGNPTKYTEDALDALIKTQFVHYIDGPSLALIIHVIHRGMLDRSANTKRKSCQIVGNMSILVDSKDLVPYLGNLVSELEIAMVDPVPSTRATAARALGSLVEKLGEEHFPDLIDKLLAALSDEGKEGDRLGSAQALSEVLSGLGVSKLEEVLPTVLAGASNARSYVRSGYMPLLLYLPICFGSQFAPYIAKILPPILAGLADDDDNINDTAIRAGKLIVTNYANKAVDLLLPELEHGLSDTNYRIRLSSVKLTGDLLFKIAGISQKTIDSTTGDEIEDESLYLLENTAANSKLIEVLGQERRDRVLSLLFVCRSDTAGMVRNAAVEIWNPIVSNTPRTIKEILPVLANIIIRRLASADETQRRISALALGDLVRRIGPSVLGQLLPTSEEIMISGDADAKQGICVALKEIMASTMESNIIEHQDVFVKIVGDAIIDSNENVREAAAQAFDALLEAVGKPAIDGIIPHLLRLLDSESESENAIKALREIMSNKAEEIFPVLIPSLLSPPLDLSKASALGALSEVAGHTLYRYLSNIINSLLDSLVTITDSRRHEISKSFTRILLSVHDDEGCHPLMQQLLSLLKNENKSKVKVVYEHLKEFFAKSVLDYSIYTTDLVQRAISSLDDADDELVKYNWEALAELVKKQSKESLESLVAPAEQSLRLVGSPGKDLKGFKIVPKGPNCVLPIFIHGLMYGNSTQKELSATAIADIVSKTPALNLKPFFTTITGPLIRVIGERVSGDVKAAILSALNMLLEKIPQFLRPFIPQLQRTFIKSLSDTSSELLRLRAAKALGSLILYQPRIDPLVNELINGVKGNEDAGVKTAMLKALIEVTSKVGFKLNETSKNGVLNLIEEEIFNVNDKLIVAYAKLIGSISRILTQEEAVKIIKDKILVAKTNEVVKGDNFKFAILTLNAFLKDSPKTIFHSGFVGEIVKFLVNGINSPDPYLSDQSILGAGKILLLIGSTKAPEHYTLPDLQVKKENNIQIDPFEIPEDVISSLVLELSKSMVSPVSNSTDSRRLSLVVIRTVARLKYDQVIKPNLNSVGPSVFSCVRDVIIPVKLAAEKSYLEVFKLVDDEELTLFNTWFNNLSENISTDHKTIKNSAGSVIQLRSIGDYTKRVGARLAKVERERIEAGGDAEAMFSDRFEDEKEIWSVGGIELAKI